MVQEILRHLADYVSGVTSREQFEDWFVPTAWNVDKSDLSGYQLSNLIFLALAEFDNGHLDEAELKTQLNHIMSQVPFSQAGRRGH
jgi:hypothetical protein